MKSVAVRANGASRVPDQQPYAGTLSGRAAIRSIFRALVEVDQPLYIHPATLPDSMIGPVLEAGLDGSLRLWRGNGMHLLRLITTGIFDRYPTLQIMVGHMGEALPYWLYRLDYMHQAGVRSKRYERLKPLNKTIAEYMRSNVLITNSGMAWDRPSNSRRK
jgi:2,3-dihydroxybenzoate decarboxylase